MKQAEQSSDHETGTTTSSVSTSSLAQGLAMVGITTGYIFGPLLVIGGIGWLLSEQFNNRIILFVALIIAFGITNVLIFTRTQKDVARLGKHK